MFDEHSREPLGDPSARAFEVFLKVSQSGTPNTGAPRRHKQLANKGIACAGVSMQSRHRLLLHALLPRILSLTSQGGKAAWVTQPGVQQITDLELPPDEKRRVGGRRSPQQPPFVTGRSNFVCELRCYIDREWCSGACGPSPVSSSCNMGVRASERARTPRLKLVCRCSRTSDCRPPQQQKGAGEQDITPTRLTFIAY